MAFSWPFLPHQAIAQAPDGFQILGVGGVGFQLLPQAADVDHQGIFIAHQGPGPKGSAQGVDGDDVPPVGPEGLEERELFGRQGNFSPRSSQ